MTSDFFISYTAADRLWSEWIAWELEEAGYSALVQAWDFRPGANFILEMDRAITAANRVILVVSAKSLASSFVQSEWAARFRQDPAGESRRLLPVRIESCDVEGLLGPMIYMDLVGLSEGQARTVLLAGVAGDRAKPTSAPAFPGGKATGAPPRRFPGTPSTQAPIPGSLPGESKERARLDPKGARHQTAVASAPSGVWTPRARAETNVGPALRSPTVTILHISDPQFGEHHRFVGEMDTLANRLVEDLAQVRAQVPEIDLIILSGDVAESGKKSEYELARIFATDLLGSLNLGLGHLVLVPGNHDVNRTLCEAYFRECEGAEESPIEPFWPKWKPYAAFAGSLHGVAAFTPDRPYGLHVYENLCTVVAALNSTISQTHRREDDYGFCGEPQLRWFAEELAAWPNFIRVAVIHHNLRAEGATATECLLDVDAFTRIVGPHIDLVLHGHTHDGMKDRLSDGTLILATGSAALSATCRPDDVGNQYQILRIAAGAITRWARRYDPQHRRWIGDTSLSVHGDQWYEEIRMPGLPLCGDLDQGDDEDLMTAGPPIPKPLTGDFIDEVEIVTRIRFKTRMPVTQAAEGVSIEQRGIDAAAGLGYLVVARGGELLAVGACDGAADKQILDLFDSSVHQQFRSRSPVAQSYLVHTGGRDPELTRDAIGRGILLKTWTEYQNLLDLTSYQAQLSHSLMSDPLYPQDLYLDQRFRRVDRAGRSSPTVLQDLAATILDVLLLDEDARFVMVLGDAGFGKSFLIRRLAHNLLSGSSGVSPVLIALREWEKSHSLVEMVSQSIAPSGSAFQLEPFNHMFRSGRIVVLIDGYDEFAVRVGYDRAAEQLGTFLQVVQDRVKIVLTSRPTHFRDREQATGKIFADVGALTSHFVFELEPFDPTEQRAFLVRWFGLAQAPYPGAHAERWMGALSRVDNLPELARTPRMLSFIARDLSLEEVEEAGRKGQSITAADLYERLVGSWIESDDGGTDHLSKRSGLPSDALWAVAESLALMLWRNHSGEISRDLLERVAAESLDLPGLGLTVAQAAQEIGGRALLAGDGDQRRFAHESVFEYVLARALARELKEGGGNLIGEAQLSELTARFLRDLAPAEARRYVAELNAEPPRA